MRKRGENIASFSFCGKENMEQLNFYTVDLSYVAYLQHAETKKRGFTRVPIMAYAPPQHPKFLCGVVLQINDNDYYVPVSSYKEQKPDNFLIVAKNGKTAGSLRFNYMFPVPKELVEVRQISSEQDPSYRALLAQELRYCIKNEETIRRLAKRTYCRVLLGKNPGLVTNSCDFPLLEERCAAYMKNKVPTLQEQIDEAKAKQVPEKAPRDDRHKEPVVR